MFHHPDGLLGLLARLRLGRRRRIGIRRRAARTIEPSPRRSRAALIGDGDRVVGAGVDAAAGISTAGASLVTRAALILIAACENKRRA
jgi:hypothetical protein